MITKLFASDVLSHFVPASLSLLFVASLTACADVEYVEVPGPVEVRYVDRQVIEKVEVPVPVAAELDVAEPLVVLVVTDAAGAVVVSMNVFDWDAAGLCGEFSEATYTERSRGDGGFDVSATCKAWVGGEIQTRWWELSVSPEGDAAVGTVSQFDCLVGCPILTMDVNAP